MIAIMSRIDVNTVNMNSITRTMVNIRILTFAQTVSM